MAKDLAGHPIGKLTPVRPTGRLYHTYMIWECRCDCGRTIERSSKHLLRKRSEKSCGCAARPKHGMAGTRTYKIWVGMLDRCHNPQSRPWKAYGGRGIEVCLRWRTFANFYADMGAAPDGLSIERIDNNRGYEPGNCRWATRAEQSRNTRASRFVEWRGRRLVLAQWARELGMSESTLSNRLKYGWPIDRVMTAPVRGRNNRPRVVSMKARTA